MLTSESTEQQWLRTLNEFVDQWNTSIGDEYLGDNPFRKFVFLSRAESWSDFNEWHESLNGNWGFRGQGDFEWLLHPTLDRAVEVVGGGVNFSYVTHVDRQATEDLLLFKFKQRAHQYVRHPPVDEDLVSWLALMQHHGVPTRLLDWTRSPYVAAYFAFEITAQNKCAIWAIDLEWLKGRGSQLLQSLGRGLIPQNLSARAAYLNALLSEREEMEPAKGAMILEVEPAQIDAWMTSQRGFFLCKRYPRATFNQLLMSMMLHPELVQSPPVRKLELPTSLRIGFLRKLLSANIHRGSLFPDLDGFSRSLSMEWEIDRDEVKEQMDRPIELPREDTHDMDKAE